MLKHLLVTNDFPPKHGGIQSYLWELWRRLPPDDVTVLTTPYAGAAAWDAAQPFRVERSRARLLLPTPALASHIDALAAEVGAELVVLDPALPLGLIGRRLHAPYAVVVHGAEVTVPGRLPGARALLATVLDHAQLIIAAGGYPQAEAARAGRRPRPAVNVPPGVGAARFAPLTGAARADARRALGIPTDALVVLGVSRLVPRKGFDVLLRAAAKLRPDHPDLVVVIGGAGRDRRRLERVGRGAGAPALFLGRVADDDMPALYASADVFAMLCRNRWLGLEQEGFGIVFLEAAAAGVAQLAGASGGAAEAVDDGVTGLVARHPRHVDEVARALGRLLDDDEMRLAMGKAARARVEAELSYDHLARRLEAAIDGVGGS